MGSIIQYIKNRLQEKSTYAGLITAVTGGSVLAAPYSYIVIVIGVVAIFAPTSSSNA